VIATFLTLILYARPTSEGRSYVTKLGPHQQISVQALCPAHRGDTNKLKSHEPTLLGGGGLFPSFEGRLLFSRILHST